MIWSVCLTLCLSVNNWGRIIVPPLVSTQELTFWHEDYIFALVSISNIFFRGKWTNLLLFWWEILEQSVAMAIKLFIHIPIYNTIYLQTVGHTLISSLETLSLWSLISCWLWNGRQIYITIEWVIKILQNAEKYFGLLKLLPTNLIYQKGVSCRIYRQ